MAQLFTLARIKQIEIAIDGTHLCAQPHDPEAQWGFKRQTFSFFGYKVIDQLQAHHPTIKVTKVFGDAGFDANENFKKVLKDLEAKPYIAINTRGKENPFLNQNLYLDKEGHLCCLSGRRLVYWGEEA